jgi:chemotaxis protein MotB
MQLGEDEGEHGPETGGLLRWLITYADLITLLLAFFIILYALNRTQEVKFTLIAQALSKEFNSTSIVGQSPGPSIVEGISGTRAHGPNTELQQLSRLQSALQQAIDQAGLGHQVSITSSPVGVAISVQAHLLFPTGRAELNPDAITLLHQLGQVLTRVPNAIEVAGYTDSTPIHTPKYPSNWQLSAMRAANVAYTLASVPGMDPKRLFVTAWSKYHPVATNATPEGRQQNRRVNIIILRSTVAEVVQQSGIGGGGL